MLATQRSHARIVQMLLDGKADPNITDEVWCCLLHVWIMYYCSLCVQTSGWTAIYFAIQNDDLEMIEMLIKEGARLDIKDNVNSTPPLSLCISPLLFRSLEWSDSI